MGNKTSQLTSGTMEEYVGKDFCFLCEWEGERLLRFNYKNGELVKVCSRLIDRLKEKSPLKRVVLRHKSNKRTADSHIWSLVNKIIQVLPLIAKKNIKFGFFVRETEENYSTWYRAMRMNTMKIADLTNNNDWDILIDITFKSKTWASDSQIESLLKCFKTVEKSLLLTSDFYFYLICDTLVLQEGSLWCKSFAEILSENLNPELKRFGQYIFSADMKDRGYEDLIQVLEKLDFLEELNFVITDCTDEEMISFCEILTRKPKIHLKTLRLYTGCPSVSQRGFEELMRLLKQYGSQITTLGWALWHRPTFSKYFVQFSEFKKLFGVLENFTRVMDLSISLTQKAGDFNLLSILKNKLGTQLNNLVSFSYYHCQQSNCGRELLKTLFLTPNLVDFRGLYKTPEIGEIFRKKQRIFVMLQAVFRSELLMKNFRRRMIVKEIFEWLVEY